MATNTKATANPKNSVITIPKVAIKSSGPDLSKHPIANSIETLISCVTDIAWALSVAVPHAQKTQIRFMRKLAARQRKNLEAIKKSNGSEQAEAIAGVLETARNVDMLLASKMPDAIVRGLFIQLFCEFDNYTGNLIRSIATLDESKFFHLKREITIGELKSLPTIDALKNDLLEKEIENLRRESYPKQFQTLEKDYELTLTKFDEWTDFVEASQRRNLFTHVGGIVSDQYISVCSANGSDSKKLKPKGSQLSLSPEYFFRACEVVEITGIMLGHTLWRRIFPAEHNLANSHLNHLVYEKLRTQNFRGALRLSEFGLSPVITKQTSGVDRRIRVINKAIALSRLNGSKSATDYLNTEDWSDTLRDFSLARAVLEERYSDAAQIMRKIGKEGELVTESAYRNWPLFFNFRKQQEFLEAYLDVFGYSFGSTITSDLPDADEVTTTANNKQSEAPKSAKSRAQPKKQKTTDTVLTQ
ncbi:hypothetical protein [Hydrogenophaga electricum]|uniref:Uncharacterized protein n=1 Tax=Hydrogenophaga electricum TaxID=1230953 RepID=A0ABQ6C2E2_9BURK|nr:hypothetical protein [Hydrogenophaga electricum]GLS13169.1 hypothetical protein GCM10007935_05980 [Hydrogenophaga electricum]